MVLRGELAVEDCLALMQVALDPADDLSLACVLKGPWCNLDSDDEHLYPLAADRKKGETLHARLMASADPAYVEAQGFVRALGARAGGDAFAFLDPVFSSGVMLALKSGVMAGDAVNAGLAANDLSPERFADYASQLRAGSSPGRRPGGRPRTRRLPDRQRSA